MSIQDLPTDPQRSVEFAKAEFARGTIFWPRLLVRCLEAMKEGKAFGVVHRTYARRCAEEPDTRLVLWLAELQNAWGNVPSIWGESLRARASEIWGATQWSGTRGDPWCQTLLRRGITRLFGATASYLGHDFHDYEVELTRALAMLTASGNVPSDNHQFAVVLQAVQEEYVG